jgi:hypothetical protein
MAGEARLMLDIQGCSDEELKELANSEIGERKKAFAAEILKRRREASWKAWAHKHTFLAAIVSLVGLGTLIRRAWR